MKNRQETESQPTTPRSAESVDLPTKTPRKPKFPYRIFKGDHVLKDCHGMSQVQKVWSKASQQPISLSFGHHTEDTPSNNDYVVKSRKGKVKNYCLLCKDMHLTYLCPRMDEASKLLDAPYFHKYGWNNLFIAA